MNNPIFKTKFPILAVVLPIFAMVVLIYSFSTTFSVISTVIIIVLLLLVSAVTFFSTSPIIVFYNDYFEVKYPFLSFLSRFKSNRYNYIDVSTVEYRQVFYFPDFIRITKKNNTKSIIYLSFRFSPNESKKIKSLFIEKEVNFYHLRYGKKK